MTVVASPQYFPAPFPQSPVACPDRASSEAVLTKHDRRWYERQLSAAGEPSLAVGMTDRADALRFTLIPTAQPTVTVRIEGLMSKTPRLIARRMSGAGGYAPGRVAARIDRALTPAEARALREVIAANDPAAVPPVECGMVTVDGSRWLIERAAHGRYVFVDHGDPDGGPVRTVGLAMLRLTGWRPVSTLR